MTKNYYEEIKARFILAAVGVNYCVRLEDMKRNRANYGVCITWGRVLDDMGHKVDIPVYEENGYLKIPRLRVDGKTIAEFEV